VTVDIKRQKGKIKKGEGGRKKIFTPSGRQRRRYARSYSCTRLAVSGRHTLAAVQRGKREEKGGDAATEEELWQMLCHS